MALELAYQNPEFNQGRQPEIGLFKPVVIEGGGDTTPPSGELSLVLPKEELDTRELSPTDEATEQELIISGLKKATKDNKKIIVPDSQDESNTREKNTSIIAALAKTKSGGGSTWSVCDCGCGREAKFGNCANIGYIRLDRRKAA